MLSYEKICLGLRCNNLCVDCELPGDETRRSLNELVADLDALPNKENLELWGGEPTLHDDLVSLVSYACRRGAKRIKLRTNGRLLADGEMLDALVREGCRIFEVSLFGSNPDTHEAVTRTRGSFNETMAGFENLHAYSLEEGCEKAIYLTVRIGVTDENVDDLLATVSLLMSFGVDVVRFVRMGSRLNIIRGAQMVATAMKVASLNRIWSVCEGFPPCTMTGSETHLMEFIQPVRFTGDKPKSCSKCVFAGICTGPPEDYLGKHGPREFRAVATFPYLQGLEYLMELTPRAY